MFYRIGTAPGSSSSPLLTWNCVALAMHNAGAEGATGSSNLIRKACVLSAVVKAYLEDNPNGTKQEVKNFEKRYSIIKLDSIF